jgi:4a-hydroxytetrahydrobiopterin dehydratase
MTDRISPKQFHESGGVDDWRVIGDGASAYFRTGSFAASVRPVQAIGQLPGVEDHKPDVDLRHDGVTVRLITYTDEYYGMSQRDVEMARRISAAAARLGLSADPLAVQGLLVIPGAISTAEVMAFWRAALGYEPRRDSPAEDLVDPRGRWPGFSFERMNEPRADAGGAIHVDVWGPYEHGASRIAAAPAAGWCATSSRRCGGRWPTPPATRSTSPPPTAATAGRRPDPASVRGACRPGAGTKFALFAE